MLPWGLGAQLANTGLAASAVLVNAYWIRGDWAGVITYPAVGAAVAFLASIYIVYELERSRAAVARQRTSAPTITPRVVASPPRINT